MDRFSGSDMGVQEQADAGAAGQGDAGAAGQGDAGATGQEDAGAALAVLQGYIRACPPGIKALVDKALTHSQRRVVRGAGEQERAKAEKALERLLQHLYADRFRTRKLAPETKEVLADALGMDAAALQRALDSFGMPEPAKDLASVPVSVPATVSAQSSVPARTSAGVREKPPLPPLRKRNPQEPARQFPQEPSRQSSQAPWQPYQYPAVYLQPAVMEARQAGDAQGLSGLAGLQDGAQETGKDGKAAWWLWVGAALALYWVVGKVAGGEEQEDFGSEEQEVGS